MGRTVRVSLHSETVQLPHKHRGYTSATLKHSSLLCVHILLAIYSQWCIIKTVKPLTYISDPIQFHYLSVQYLMDLMGNRPYRLRT